MAMDMFADGFGEVSLLGATVRIDLVAHGQPGLETRGRLVMPIEGFVQGFETAQRVMQLLVDQGLVRPRAAQDAAIDPVRSPNFESGAQG